MGQKSDASVNCSASPSVSGGGPTEMLFSGPRAGDHAMSARPGSERQRKLTPTVLRTKLRFWSRNVKQRWCGTRRACQPAISAVPPGAQLPDRRVGITSRAAPPRQSRPGCRQSPPNTVRERAGSHPSGCPPNAVAITPPQQTTHRIFPSVSSSKQLPVAFLMAARMSSSRLRPSPILISCPVGCPICGRGFGRRDPPRPPWNPSAPGC